MGFDWKVAIVKLVMVKQALDDADLEKVWTYTLPRVRASQADINGFEMMSGKVLDSQYADFLRHANGWPAFYHSVDLFGLEELRGGGAWLAAQERIQELESEGTLRLAGVTSVQLLPIAASERSADVFVIVRGLDSIVGTVIWFAGYEVARFANFEEFFLSMTENQREEVAEVKAKFQQ